MEGIGALGANMAARAYEASGAGRAAFGATGATRATDPSSIIGDISADGVSGSKGGSFGDTLANAMADATKAQQVADAKSMALVTGQNIPVHEVMAAVTEAELTVQLTTAIASKAIQAYQEIWRMEI